MLDKYDAEQLVDVMIALVRDSHANGGVVDGFTRHDAIVDIMTAFESSDTCSKCGGGLCECCNEAERRMND